MEAFFVVGGGRVRHVTHIVHAIVGRCPTLVYDTLSRLVCSHKYFVPLFVSSQTTRPYPHSFVHS